MTRKSEFLYAHDASRFYFTWLSIVLVFIATLVTAGGLMLYNSVQGWQRGVSESLTVQIMTYDDNGVSRDENIYRDIESALTVLRTTPGILGASVLTDAQMADLMSPWIGSDVSINDLPLPKLIDVSIDVNNPPDLELLRSELSQAVPLSTLDSHRIWLDSLINLSVGAMNLVGFILLLLAATISFTVVCITRASLRIHESVIHLIHMTGATDFYITIRYAWRSFHKALFGGILGFLCSLPILFGIIFFLQNTGDLISQSGLTWSQWIILLVFPLMMSVLAFLTSYYTVMKFLKRFV